MQLVLVAHGGGAAFKVAHVAVVVGNDECALKLSRVAGVDAEVAAQLHGAAHATGDVDEGAIAEDGTVEGGVEVVAIGHYGTQILSHQVGVLLDGVTDTTEDDALLAQLLLEGCLHAHRVHDGIHGGVAAQRQPLLQGDAQLVESLYELGVYRAPLGGRKGGFFLQRIRIVADGLIVHLWHMNVAPGGLLLLAPVAEGTQAEVEHPLWLAFLLRDEAHHVLVQPLVDDLGADVGGEAKLVFLLRYAAHQLIVVLLFLLHVKLRVHWV